MKLSISNIAWPREKMQTSLKNIKEWGCSGLEIAPGLIWENPAASTAAERRQLKALVKEHNLELVAMQALLFGRREMCLFKGKETDLKTSDYLKKLCQLAADLEIRNLVFGSPLNRMRNGLDLERAFEQAAEFFSPVAHCAAELGVCVCIEPLAPRETDFINTVSDGLRLIEMVNSAGFGLHLDAAALAAEGNDFFSVLKPAIGRIKHFHISEPGLAEINSTGEVDHAALAKALCEINYDGYVSIEMRKTDDYDNTIRRSLDFSNRVYLSAKASLR